MGDKRGFGVKACLSDKGRLRQKEGSRTKKGLDTTEG